MDRRTKILASVFGSVILYAIVARTVYPSWIQPLMTYDERIALRQKELDELNVTEADVDQGRYAYKEYVTRIGSFDIAKVENAIRQQLNSLIEKHDLKEASVSPSRVSEDRKTGVESKVLTVQAEGPLHGIAGLMRDVAELPQLLRFGNISISPGKSTLSGGRPTLHEQVDLRMPIEIAVLPRHPMVGSIDESKLPPPEAKIRHRYTDYAALWDGRPFSTYIKVKPLQAQAGGDQTIQRPGRNLILRGKVSGGIGQYTMQWSPSDGLDKPTALTTRVNTDTPGEYEYTLTVTDESGATASDMMALSVRELAPGKPTKPKPGDTARGKKPRDKRWKDGKYQQVVMVLGRTHRGERMDEVMLFNRRSKDTEYYAAGDEFDGGTLVYVHQTGVLAQREKEYYVYPIGEALNNDVKLADATFYPELLSAAERHKVLVASQETSDAAEVEGDGKAEVTNEPGKDADAADSAAPKAPEQDTVKATPAGAKARGKKAPSGGADADMKREANRRPRRIPGTGAQRKNRTRRSPGDQPRKPKSIKPGGKKPD